MRILPVEPRHIPALSQLAMATFTETFAHLYPPEDLSAFLEKSYAPEKLVAEIADPARAGELKRLYVHSSQQGKGLGRMLMGVALGWLDEIYGQAPQWIGVWSENHKAQALYRSYDFEQVGAYQFPVGQTLDDEFILRRQP